MKRLWIAMAVCMYTMMCAAQGTVKGKVLEKASDLPMGYVNVVVKRAGDDKIYKGIITDEKGVFTISELPYDSYTLTVTFMGYKELNRSFTLSQSHAEHSYNALYLSEDATNIKEVVVTGQRSGVKLEVDRKSFDVTQDIANAGGSASDVLGNIPSVEVDNDGNVSLRGNSSVEVWINGKASGLTSENRAQILEQMPAESIERIEVIDNPSAKFSAEGSAGIINIVLKKDRKAGYSGSVQVGAHTRGGVNTSANINYTGPVVDAYANIGYRHRERTGGSNSYQTFFKSNEYQRYSSSDSNLGNNLFARAGLTWHISGRDDLSVNGMTMLGKRKEYGLTPYHYGTVGAAQDTKVMTRNTRSGNSMQMYYADVNYRHTFADKHYLDFTLSHNRWDSDNLNYYRDSTTYFDGTIPATTYSYQYRPMFIRNYSWEAKLDYERPIGEFVKLQTGYQGNFSGENTPQESWVDNNSWNGDNVVEEQAYYNRFIYHLDVHAFYATTSYNRGKFGLMAGLRGEYWRVNTESYNWEQEYDPTKRESPFKKDFFQLFPSLFMSYQLTPSQQLQLNYTRRLRRPWGGELNSFKDTRDATNIRFGNPALTPEYSHSFSLNYLKTWTGHSLLLSAYYRPTTDVIQRVRWQDENDGLMYQTYMNVTKSQSTGLELVMKNKLWKRLDLTTTANAYYYHLDGFSYTVNGQTITGNSDNNFTWNARTQASIILPYDITFQATGSYTARQVVTQGYRKANYMVEMGVRKNFFDKQLTVALNCRDLLNSQKWEIVTGSDTFSRYMERWGGGRRVNLTLTWNFGNMKQKRSKDNLSRQGDEEHEPDGGYSSGVE